MLGEKDDVISYLRSEGTRRYLIVLNFGPKAKTYLLPHPLRGEVRISTHLDREGERLDSATIKLRADEGVVVEISDDRSQ